MKKYSLKDAFYKKSFLLNEMALITPRNFLEKIIRMCQEDPRLIGIPSINSVEKAFDFIEDSLFKKHKYLTNSEETEFIEKLNNEFKEKEADRQKSIEIRKSKGIKVNEKDLIPITLSEKEKQYRLKLYEATAVKEKTIALEIIKIVHVTEILQLKGKENKKKLKKAEEILTQQIRKHKNSDGEFIEFKKVLPMFDSIIQYIEKSVDIDIDTCIRAADLYMRSYYDIANKEEKDEIDKGNFDFSIIIKRMTFVKDYKKREASVSGQKMLSDSLLRVYEDDNMLIVYPTKYQSFKYMIEEVLGISGLTWCTYRQESTWSNYNSEQYVAIAHVKGADYARPAYAISLKVRKDGSIDVEGTCDFNNKHVDSDFLYEYITEEMEAEISKLPEQVDLQTDISELEDNIIGLSNLNDVNELKNCFSQSLAFSGIENSIDLYELMCTETTLSKEDSAEVIVDSMSHYIFDNLSAETFYFSDFFNVTETYPAAEIYSVLKRKILNKRSHPRYLNAFLEIDKLVPSQVSYNNFKILSDDEFKKALEISCNTNNINNLKRIISLTLESNKYRTYLNPYKIANKSEGLTAKNIEIYDMLVNSQGIRAYISEFGVNAVNKITGRFDAKPDVFISRLIFRYPEIFTNQLKGESKDSSEDFVASVDLNLVTRYIIEDAERPGKFLDKSKSKRRFLSLDENSYQEIKENLLKKYETFNQIKNYLKNEDAYVLYKLIAYNIENSNPFNMSYDQEQFNVFNDLTSFKDIYKSSDYFANFITFLSVYNKNATDLNVKTLENIAKYINSAYGNDELTDSAACQSFFEMVILDNTTREFDFKYAYEIFETLPDRLRAFIIKKTFNKARLSILNGRRNFNNVIKNIQNKSKIFVKSSNFIDNYYSLHNLQIPKFTFLILTFLDFIPLKKRKVYFSQFVKQLFSKVSTNYESTYERSLATNAIQTIDMEIIGSEETINVLREKINHVVRYYGKVELHTFFINSLIHVFTQNNKAFPKDIMQKIATISTGKNYNSASGIKNFFKNFIGISEDDSSHLYGKELSIVRETLKELFRDREFSSNSSMFGSRYSKEIAFEIVQKMGKHARMHMGMAFPEEASNLRANTPEEEAELQMDSLVRQYVKMLLS
jgi:hypothetical protein